MVAALADKNGAGNHFALHLTLDLATGRRFDIILGGEEKRTVSCSVPVNFHGIFRSVPVLDAGGHARGGAEMGADAASREQTVARIATRGLRCFPLLSANSRSMLRDS